MIVSKVLVTWVIAPRIPVSRCRPLTAIATTLEFLVAHPSTIGASKTGCSVEPVVGSEAKYTAGHVQHGISSQLGPRSHPTVVQVGQGALRRRFEQRECFVCSLWKQHQRSQLPAQLWTRRATSFTSACRRPASLDRACSSLVKNTSDDMAPHVDALLLCVQHCRRA